MPDATHDARGDERQARPRKPPRQRRIINGNTYFHCRACDRWRVETAFHADPDPHSRSGRKSQCKQCRRQRAKELWDAARRGLMATRGAYKADPTPEQIERMKREIAATWTPGEASRRALKVS